MYIHGKKPQTQKQTSLCSNTAMSLLTPKTAVHSHTLYCIYLFIFYFFYFLQTGIFGLCYKTKKGHDWWLLLDKPIRKQLERHAANGLSNIKLKFKIRFFTTDSCWMKLQDKAVRWMSCDEYIFNLLHPNSDHDLTSLVCQAYRAWEYRKWSPGISWINVFTNSPYM